MKVDFVCSNCGFHFSAEKKKDSCPYCGEKKIKESENAEGIVSAL